MIEHDCRYCRSLGFITEEPTHAKLKKYGKRALALFFLIGIYWIVIRALAEIFARQ